jgi:hypothetical protein
MMTLLKAMISLTAIYKRDGLLPADFVNLYYDSCSSAYYLQVSPNVCANCSNKDAGVQILSLYISQY